MYGIGNISATLNDVLRPCNGLGKSEPYVAPYKTELKLMSRRWNRWSYNQVLWGKFIDALKKLIDPKDLISNSFKTLVVYPMHNDEKTFEDIAQALDYAFDKGWRNKRDWFVINDKDKAILTGNDIPKTLQGVLQGLYGVPVDGLGKPTIKLEFETNSELADFLSSNKQSKQYAPYTDVTATETPTAANAKAKSKIRNGILMPADDSRTFPEPPTASALPPTKTPPPLPPAPTAKALPEYVEEKELSKYNTQIENYYIAKNKYPNHIIIFSYLGVGVSILDDATIVSIALDLPIYEATEKTFVQINGKNDGVLKAAEKLQRQGYNVVVLNSNMKPILVLEAKDATNDAQPETTQPEVTAESVTDEEIEKSNVTPVEIDWKAFEDAFAKASNWASFDPERSARSYVGGYKEYYDQYVKQVPPQYLNAFNWFVKRYVSDLISKRSRTASAAVTGPGGITAQKAASLNRANDRFMSASVEFPHALLKFINKIRLREKRNAFVNSSIDDRYAQRISELKKEVNGLMYLKDTYEHIANGGEIPEEVRRRYAWMSRAYGTSNLRESILKSLNYNLNLQKATFKDKLMREVSKGNVEIIDAIIDYLKPKGLFTNRAEIWQFPSFVRTRRESVERETQRVDDAAADDNALYRVEYDEQEDRVKIYFNGMPSDKIRTYLKSNGFRWSPRNKAWQRQITENARRAVRQFESLIQDGTLGKPTIKLEFEDNGELMSLFDTDGISGFTVNDKPADLFNCPESALQTQGYKPTYRRLPDYSHLIDTADGRKTLKGYGFDSATLDELITACTYYPQVSRLAAHLKDPDGDPLQSAFNVWHWLHTNIRYAYDTPGEEEIRTPARTWADRNSGVDCDCLAVMTACLLLNMGYRPQFEIVAFKNSPTFSHIYVTLDGYAIDRVLPVFLSRPEGITNTKIMDIPVYSLSGIDGCTLDGLYASTLDKLQTGEASADDINNYRKTQVLVTLRGIDDDAYTLATLLMNHVITIGDDGKWYFDSSKVADLAKKLDTELAQLKQQGATPESVKLWFAQAIDQLDGVTATANSDEDTIVVIINPRGCCPCNITAQMSPAELQSLTPMAQTATATEDVSPLFALTETKPELATDWEGDDDGSGFWYVIAGSTALLTLSALVSSNKKKQRR